MAKYFLVGAFIPFSVSEAHENMLLEESFMHAQGIQGLVNMEGTIDNEKKTVYFAEILETNKTAETLPALQSMIARITNMHKCKSVCSFTL